MRMVSCCWRMSQKMKSTWRTIWSITRSTSSSSTTCCWDLEHLVRRSPWAASLHLSPRPQAPLLPWSLHTSGRLPRSPSTPPQPTTPQSRCPAGPLPRSLTTARGTPCATWIPVKLGRRTTSWWVFGIRLRRTAALSLANSQYLTICTRSNASLTKASLTVWRLCWAATWPAVEREQPRCSSAHWASRWAGNSHSVVFLYCMIKHNM